MDLSLTGDPAHRSDAVAVLKDLKSVFVLVDYAHGRARVPVPGVRQDVRSAVDAEGAHDHAHQDVQLHVPALLKGELTFNCRWRCRAKKGICFSIVFGTSNAK